MRIIRKILKYLIVLCLFLLTLTVTFLAYLRSDFHQPFDETELNKLVDNIKKDSQTDKRLYNYYSKMHKIKNTDGLLLGLLNKENNLECPCLNLSNLMIRGFDLNSKWNRISKNRYIYNYKLESKLSHEECFNYWINRFDFLYQNRGVTEAANFYFQKSINQLNEDEILSLLIQLRNPSINNPRKHPERLKRKIEIYKRMMKLSDNEK